MCIPGCRRHSATPRIDLDAMGKFDLDQQSGTINDIPWRFRELDGQHVILQGFMWAPASDSGEVTNFQLVYNITGNSFHPPLVQARVFCTVAGGKSAPYYADVVEVTGTLHVGIDREDGKIISVYTMDVESVTK
jgi:hypothetical protein